MPAANVIKRLCSRTAINFNLCCYKSYAKVLVRHSAIAVHSKSNIFVPVVVKVRNLGLGPTSKEFDEPTQKTGPLTKAHATELVLHLKDEERKVLFTALQEYESNSLKEEFEDKLAGLRWRRKLGRSRNFPSLGDVDPTGSYCPVPEEWLKKKYASTVPKPSTRELFHLLLSHSIPFVGFGFLDNFIMIIAGDSIESSMSAYITLSTMAAAALGNTFSDVIGIGSSYYVERAAAMIGLGAPALSPVQLDMPITRRFTNAGRVLGITVGCFLGMIPLLFKDDEKKTEKKTKKADNLDKAE